MTACLAQRDRRRRWWSVATIHPFGPFDLIRALPDSAAAEAPRFKRKTISHLPWSTVTRSISSSRNGIELASPTRVINPPTITTRLNCLPSRSTTMAIWYPIPVSGCDFNTDGHLSDNWSIFHISAPARPGPRCLAACRMGKELRSRVCRQPDAALPRQCRPGGLISKYTGLGISGFGELYKSAGTGVIAPWLVTPKP